MKLTSVKNQLLMAIFIMSLLLNSCKKDKNSSPPEAVGDPIITAVGTPTGTISITSIGASGGSLQSADGNLTITFPAGALSANTEISIQPIKNEAPLGLGSGYRLEPEGTNFTIPVQLVFHYNAELLNESHQDFLWIVTQAADGSWNAMLKSVVDTNAKTVTIETTHFSDWSLGRFIDFVLSPVSKTIQKGQSVQLSLTGFSRDRAIEEDELAPLIPITDNNEGDLAPLTPIPPTESRLMDFRVKQWTMNGATAPVSNSNGSLSASGKSATYTAPNKLPSTNPVAVSVELEVSDNAGKKASYQVTSSISVVESDLYVEVTIDGIKHEYFEYGVNGTTPPDPNNIAMVNCGLDDAGNFSIVCMDIINSTEMHNSFVIVCSNPSKGTKDLICRNDENGEDEINFQPFSTPAEGYYSLDYVKRTKDQNNICNADYICGSASLTFTEYNGVGGIAEGNFSGMIYEDNDEISGKCQSSKSHNVSGFFRVKLLF
jgi:hypothetical protein